MANLAMGSSGSEVTTLQQKLVELGYYVGNVDGDFQEKTGAAVAYFQSCHGLRIDAVVGPETREALNLGDGYGISLEVEVKWPEIDVWHPGDELPVEIKPLGEVNNLELRVVMWYRSPAGEHHSEVSATVNGTATTIARVPLNPFTAESEGEVHYTGIVFDMNGRELGDQGTGSFRVDLPDRIGS
jgi:peptidoglycan hydrolase-like protein with peptidoglycan-binding domain